MKKILCALITSASLMLAGAVHADVIGFDDVNTGGDFASLNDLNPYAGLNWGAEWYAGDTSIDGYANGARSGAQFAVNGFGGEEVSISSATAFNFGGAWFATPEGAADKASWINISAYDAMNQLIGSTGNVAINDTYLWVAASFNNVALLTITNEAGWFVMDDFSTIAATAVPVPATPLVMAIGLLALGLARRLHRRGSC